MYEKLESQSGQNSEITSELIGSGEENAEKRLLGFADNIAYSYEQKRKEYLQFITADNVDADEVMTVLNTARLLQRLYNVSKDIVGTDETGNSVGEELPCTALTVKKTVSELQVVINKVMEAIKKEHDDILDDDDYLHKAQEIHRRRKKFRSYSDLCNAYLEILDSFSSESNPAENTPAQIIADVAEESFPVIRVHKRIPETPENRADEPETSTSSDLLHLTENDFCKWIIENCNMSKETATNNIRLIHKIEQLYEKLFGIKKVLFGDIFAKDAEEMIRTVIQTNEYSEEQKINKGYKSALEKYSTYAGLDVSIFKNREKLRTFSPRVSSSDNDSSVKMTADIDSCIYHDQSALSAISFKGQVQPVHTWEDLYREFLFKLFIDHDYRTIIMDLIGKPLNDGKIYFADQSHSDKLRKKLYIAPGFYAEGKLTDTEIINRIKHIMELCAIDNDKLIIEYSIPY